MFKRIIILILLFSLNIKFYFALSPKNIFLDMQITIKYFLIYTIVERRYTRFRPPFLHALRSSNM